jgi:flagellar biosynthesis anti-sigma factor FlgM
MAVQLYGVSGRAIQNSSSNSSIRKKGGVDLAASTSPSNSTETVSVSSAASQLQALEAAISEMPIADMPLVESIQLALSTGEYHVSGEASANGLLEIERKLP